jgi:large subunit ribosomal protein L7/L12
MIRASEPAAGKVKAAEEFEAVFARSKSVLVADFTGMPVSEFDRLRRECFNRKVVFRVTKNTIARLVLERHGFSGMDRLLIGQTGFCFGFDDPFLPIRLISDFARDNKRPAIKGYLFEGRLYGREGVEQLRNIPSREVLLAQVIGAMTTPLSGLVFVLNEILRSFVSVVDAVAQNAEGDPTGRTGLTAIGGSVNNIVEAIEKMTVLELVELKKALEEKFGVTAAAPMAMAAAMPGASAAAEAPAAEQTEFTIVLISSGDKKIQVIKEVRAITGLGLKEAKDLVDGAPKTVKEAISKEEAMAIKAKIEEAGGSVELK